MFIKQQRRYLGGNRFYTVSTKNSIVNTNNNILSLERDKLYINDSINSLVNEFEKKLDKWEREGFVHNNNFQEKIEEFCIDQFYILGSKTTFTHQELPGVQLDGVTDELSIYLMGKLEVIKKYIKYILPKLELEYDFLLKNSKLPYKRFKLDSGVSVKVDCTKDYKNNVKKSTKPGNVSELDFLLDKKKLMLELIKSLNRDSLAGACIFIFYTCLSYWESDDDDRDNHLTLVPISSKIGKQLIDKYLYLKYSSLFEGLSLRDRPRYSEWKVNYLKSSYYAYLEDDTFISELGCMLIEVLEASGLVKKELIRIDRKEHKYIISVVDKHILKKFGNKIIRVLPFKLPMIVEPKPYSKNELGGYLLNGIKVTDSLIIEKKGYKHNSELEGGVMYELVNGVSRVPYKVNGELLDFIIENKHLELLIDLKTPHKFENKVRSKYQSRIYKSHLSKILLQENILNLASIYRRFSAIYLLSC